MTNTTDAPAVDCPVERKVRAHDPDRAAFEAWWCKAYHPAKLARQEHGCYLDLSAGMAWDAWQAARPKRAAVGRLVNLAALLTSPTPMRKLWQLEEEAGRTLGRRALSDSLADSDERLKTLAIELAALAQAL